MNAAHSDQKPVRIAPRKQAAHRLRKVGKFRRVLVVSDNAGLDSGQRGFVGHASLAAIASNNALGVLEKSLSSVGLHRASTSGC